MKLVIVVTLLAVGFALLGLFAPWPDYHYKGMAEVPIEDALQIQLDYGSDRVAVTTYSPGIDTVYMAYNFWGKEEGLYGLDSERNILKGRIFPVALLFVFSLVLTVVLNLWSDGGIPVE